MSQDKRNESRIEFRQRLLHHQQKLGTAVPHRAGGAGKIKRKETVLNVQFDINLIPYDSRTNTNPNNTKRTTKYNGFAILCLTCALLKLFRVAIVTYFISLSICPHTELPLSSTSMMGHCNGFCHLHDIICWKRK